MVTVFITYDLKELPKGIHLKVKTDLIANYGYSARTLTNEADLPNTFLLKQNITPDNAFDDLKAVVAKHGGTLERSYSGIVQQPKYYEM
jgi:hypothetical protein